MSWSPSRSPRSGTMTPCVRLASARYLVTWSATAIPAARATRRAIRPRRRRWCCVIPVLPTPTAAVRWTAAVVIRSATELRRTGLAAPGDVAAALDVGKQRLEVALEAGAGLPLQGPPPGRPAPQERTLPPEP